MVKKLKETLLKSSGLLLVDFYADWCGPCQTMDPVLQQVISEASCKVELIKINIDKHPQASVQFGVRSIPHYLLIRKGKILWRKGGVITKRELLQVLKGFQ
jgi:thioredoxin 1